MTARWASCLLAGVEDLRAFKALRSYLPPGSRPVGLASAADVEGGGVTARWASCLLAGVEDLRASKALRSYLPRIAHGAAQETV